MGDYTKYLAQHAELRDYRTGEVRQNPNLFGNPYRRVDKKRFSSMMSSVNECFNILVRFFPFVFFTAVGDDRFSLSSDSSESSSKFSLSSRRKHEGSLRDKLHRSKASIAARKHGLEEEEASVENDNSNGGKDLKLDMLDSYSWKGSRKKVLLQLFVAVWKQLCEKESVQFSEKLENTIREDVRVLTVPDT